MAGKQSIAFGRDVFELKVEGLEPLLAKLASISDDMRFRGGRAALRKGANVIRDAAQAGARGIDDPTTAENIAKNIVVRWSPKTFKTSGDLAFRVGVLGGAQSASAKEQRKAERRRAKTGGVSLADRGEIAGKGAANPGGDTWYWRLIEYGTKRSRATPFMRPALDRSGAAVAAAFITEYSRAIDRALRRAAKLKGLQ